FTIDLVCLVMLITYLIWMSASNRSAEETDLGGVFSGATSVFCGRPFAGANIAAIGRANRSSTGDKTARNGIKMSKVMAGSFLSYVWERFLKRRARSVAPHRGSSQSTGGADRTDEKNASLPATGGSVDRTLRVRGIGTRSVPST